MLRFSISLILFLLPLRYSWGQTFFQQTPQADLILCSLIDSFLSSSEKHLINDNPSVYWTAFAMQQWYCRHDTFDTIALLEHGTHCRIQKPTASVVHFWQNALLYYSDKLRCEWLEHLKYPKAIPKRSFYSQLAIDSTELNRLLRAQKLCLSEDSIALYCPASTWSADTTAALVAILLDRIRLATGKTVQTAQLTRTYFLEDISSSGRVYKGDSSVLYNQALRVNGRETVLTIPQNLPLNVVESSAADLIRWRFSLINSISDGYNLPYIQLNVESSPFPKSNIYALVIKF